MYGHIDDDDIRRRLASLPYERTVATPLSRGEHHFRRRNTPENAAAADSVAGVPGFSLSSVHSFGGAVDEARRAARSERRPRRPAHEASNSAADALGSHERDAGGRRRQQAEQQRMQRQLVAWQQQLSQFATPANPSESSDYYPDMWAHKVPPLGAVALRAMVDRESRLPKTLPDDCAICCEPRRAGQTVLALACGHSFHSACARKWLACSACCPLCKADVR